MGVIDYSLHRAAEEFARNAARQASIGSRLFGAYSRIMGNPVLADHWRAAALYLNEEAKHHPKPEWGIHDTTVGGKTVSVVEEAVKDYPFMELIHFRKNTNAYAPKLLIIAPMSGHYATLLRGTVKDMLPENDVYVTDWKNARDVPLSAGRFGVDEYIGYLMDAIRTIGPRTHILGVCQPGPLIVAATALMAQANDPLQPASMTLIASPIDVRRSPTQPVNLANENPLSFFENLTSVVPYGCGFKGAGRRVYPGHLQLMNFMMMNWERHADKRRKFYEHLVQGDEASAEAHRTFYDEYNAVMDMTAEFYMETIQRVFKEAHLAKGQFVVGGQLVDPGAIRRTSALFVGGGKDDITAPPQVFAADDLLTGLAATQKRRLLHPGVGHYGAFTGSEFQKIIAPKIISHIHESDVDNGLKYRKKSTNTRPMPPNSGLIPGAIPA